MRVLVTGAAGFLGSHVVDRFLAERYEVVGVDNLITGSRRNLAHLEHEPGFDFVEHDISEPFYFASKLDGVLHFASPASPPDYLDFPIRTLRAGGLGTLNTLGLACRHGARYLLASTSEVYGVPAIHPQPETYWGNVNSVGPRSVYDEAKRYAEALTMAYHRARAVDTRIIRIFNTYGPRMRPGDGRVISNFIVQGLQGEPMTVYGDGLQTRSFCYVDDEIEGIFRLFQSSYVHPVNIGNPVEFQIREVARFAMEETDSSAPLTYLPLPIDDPRMRCPDIAVARRVLDWEPATDLRQGIRKTIPYFRALLEREGAVSRNIDTKWTDGGPLSGDARSPHAQNR